METLFDLSEFEFVRRPISQDDDTEEERRRWIFAAAHRKQVTQLLLEAATENNPTLCVFGAGPCNDLELSELLDRYREVHLVDLDGDALWRGITRQGVASVSQINLCGNCDVTGVAHALRQHRQATDPPDSVENILSTAADYQLLQVAGPFDVVASVCLLSQLVQHLVKCLGDDHPLFLNALETIRQRHLELLIEKCRPGGTVLLIFDFVSDQTLPSLPTLAGDELRRVLSNAIHDRNFFHGMNPVRLNELILNDPAFSGKVEGLEAIYPWVWRALERQYAVTAIRFRRA